MERFRLVIADRDRRFLKAINNYFISQKLNSFELISISDYERLNQQLQTIEGSLDLLLINKELLLPELNVSKAAIVIELLEEQEAEEELPRKGIYKYQPGDRLVNQILQLLYEAKPGRNLLITKKEEASLILLFYSPSGGIGLTSACIAAARATAQLGGKVLYLNFEAIPSHALLLKPNDTLNASKLYYAIKKRSSNIMLKLEANVLADTDSGLHYLAPADSLLELEELTVEDLQLLLSSLKESRLYDYIFIDSSPQFNIKTKFLMVECDTMVLMSEASTIGSLKLSMLERELMRNNLDAQITDKLVLLQKAYADGEDIRTSKLNPHAGAVYKLPVMTDIYINRAMGLDFNGESECIRTMSAFAGDLIKSNKRND